MHKETLLYPVHNKYRKLSRSVGPSSEWKLLALLFVCALFVAPSARALQTLSLTFQEDTGANQVIMTFNGQVMALGGTAWNAAENDGLYLYNSDATARYGFAVGNSNTLFGGVPVDENWEFTQDVGWSDLQGLEVQSAAPGGGVLYAPVEDPEVIPTLFLFYDTAWEAGDTLVWDNVTYTLDNTTLADLGLTAGDTGSMTFTRTQGEAYELVFTYTALENVPEPSAWAMIVGMGCLGLIGIRYRGHRRGVLQR